MTDGTISETDLDAAEQREAVRDRYAELAAESSCCGDASDDAPGCEVTELGYAESDVETVAAADLSLGCGNPTAIAGLDVGDTVLDLGSGGGFDCFLAAREVGEAGRVIGVDMTPEMVERARDEAAENGATNVEFRLGEIEHLPVADESVDVVISNCVVNLSPDKSQAFDEVYRVLRPGGRVAISDVVRTADLPVDLRTALDSVAACLGGAASIPALDSMLTEAGFVDVAIEPEDDSEEFIREWDDDRDPSEYVVSATIEARKPASDRAPRGETDGALSVRPADESDLDRVEALLAAADLPSEDIHSKPDSFFLARVDGDVVGAGGLEIHGPNGLLRSLVVRDPYRGQGYGTAICDELEAVARAQGVETLYLLTTTAADFFRRRGFEETDRADVPDAIRETVEFTDLCPASATCLRADIG